MSIEDRFKAAVNVIRGLPKNGEYLEISNQRNYNSIQVTNVK